MMSILETLVQEWQQILGAKLVGIYLHGSLCLGGFQAETSDIDLLVVIEEEMADAEKNKLMLSILNHLDDYPQKGLEMSVVLCKDIQKPSFPMPYSLHFSPMYLCEAKQDSLAYAQKMHGYDDDLAVHLTITKEKGIALYGPNPQQLFASIPKQAYLDSILQDLKDGQFKIYENPGYYILNLCRTLAYLKDDLILSKDDGGKWALTKSNQHISTIKKALLELQNNKVNYSQDELRIFYRDYMDLILNKQQLS